MILIFAGYIHLCFKHILHELYFFEVDFLQIIFTNLRKRASGLPLVSFKASISKYLFLFVHCFGIIIKEKCSPFNQGIIQQPIMSINKVITPMTELSEPPSYIFRYW